MQLTFVDSVILNRLQFAQHTDIKARMPFVMRLKIEDHNRCVAEHKCPLVTNSLSNIPCRSISILSNVSYNNHMTVMT